jgi:RHS repeat-associated protein
LKKEYVYGTNGLLAIIEPSVGTRYSTSDHLGTPRVVTGSTGAVLSRHDYQPFGEEIFAGTGGRTTTQGYVGDSIRQKFTGYERDDETNLDYAKARYFGSSFGRFTSPDPIMMTKGR